MKFEERERGFEAKFVHDEAVRFRLVARRDKLFADWAARQHGLPPVEADRLHHAVLAVPGGSNHDAAVLALVRGLGSTAGGRTLADLAAALLECEAQAMQPSAGDQPSPFDL